MATAERQGNRRREGETYWSAQVHGRIISVNGHDFFAPTDLMRLVSEYRSPRKVCERAGLKFHRWQSWERKYANTRPWVLDYLLRVQKKSVPKGHIVHQISQQKCRKRPPKDNECYTTEEQEAFRRNATNEAAIEHAKHDLAAGKAPAWLRDAKRATSSATRKMLEAEETRSIARKIVHALKVIKQHTWYRPWQTGARTPAETVTVLQPAEVARLETLLDVRPTLKAVGSQIGTWDDWRKSLPSERTNDFIHWMLGGPEPNGWLIIGGDVEKLQAEARTAAIERAAKCPGQHARWTDEVQKRALQAAIEDARSSGVPSLENDPRWREYADAVDVTDDDGRRRTTVAVRAKTLATMKRFAKHAAPKAIRKRAGWSEGEWTDLKSKSSKVGCAEDLERHIYNQHEVTQGQRFAKSGIIADKLFRASQAMEKFRVVHQKTYVATKGSTLAKLPSFDAFVVIWTELQDWHSKRSKSQSVEMSRRVDGDERSAEAATATNGNKSKIQPRWEIGNRHFRYMGGELVPCREQCLKVLDLLVRRTGAVTMNDLIKLWGDGEIVEERTVRTTIGHLRQVIRLALRLPKEYQPILNRRLAYELNSDLR